ncbi:hypothetical protein A3C21_01255 [Candidatus Kaiserbacteria bacterium RIFCSPHIGHO2_02_FULL_59_21]|uniref:Uncharacterized protein n=2 Tax=Candidatus Kaiseribacteriota TaxID=1752734 RepID=A0A0G1YUH5_9BACT|nr:MAG: hypothetical protein UY98_C0023G0013 [Candidatus Kaiserbacteria bacterium GW2011_GWA2_58_9]OGG63061.1 MAG: hypothetical protein A2766_01985 [Candidatus Kaiserbacteria bacterium RIFCSPHIGHO2_01_FULL_58_22]OGG67424.1 MAG: hypothetical protein A3C21_01255 [Candidatus Kaiserbacteria bacterium RIFCSPHIGHO2_02_FULL_59_21]OGG80273.1 MAG: hypothetical protein A2952_01890 [Candidatus Kaiserbacteria bacterium RIFCSPLOWO2_01_FULL_59_34]OGG85800.1 MAG: hypothetical protein A3I47_00170 [Candidatus K
MDFLKHRNRTPDIARNIRNAREGLEGVLEGLGITQARTLIAFRTNAWLARMREKYPNDYLKVKAYHAIAGTTPPDEATTDDFEGEDSVFELFASIRREFNKSSE